MALIQVTPDLLNGKANELRGYKDQHDDAMAKMRALIMGLNEVWKGDVEDYAKLMDTAAQRMQETDQSLSTTMTSFG